MQNMNEQLAHFELNAVDLGLAAKVVEMAEKICPEPISKLYVNTSREGAKLVHGNIFLLSPHYLLEAPNWQTSMQVSCAWLHKTVRYVHWSANRFDSSLSASDESQALLRVGLLEELTLRLFAVGKHCRLLWLLYENHFKMTMARTFE